MATPAQHSYDPAGESVTDGQTDRPRLELSTERRDGALVVALTGELDLSNAETLRGVLAGAGDASRVVVDVAALEFLDSTGLNLLLGEHRRLKAAGVPLVLAGAQGEVGRLLRLTGVDQLFALAPDVDAALAD